MPTTLQDDLNRTIPGSGIRSILINVLVGTGVALGLAPLAGFVGHLPWLIYVFAASALISSGKTGRVFTAAVEQPSWWHFAVSGCGTLFPAAVLGVLGFALVAVNWLLNVIFRMSGLTGAVSHLVTYLPFVNVALLAAMGVGMVQTAAETMVGQLYPDTASERPDFRRLANDRAFRTRLVWSLAPTVLAVCLLSAFLILNAKSPAIVEKSALLDRRVLPIWQFLLLLTSFSAFSLGSKTIPISTRQTLQAVDTLLKALGYSVVQFPRTGDSGTDAVLGDIDIFAENNRRTVLLSVRTRQNTSQDVDWQIASSIRSGARAYDAVRFKRVAVDRRSQVVIVLIDLVPDPTLMHYCQDESVLLFAWTSQDVQTILKETAGDEASRIQQAAEKWLGEVAPYRSGPVRATV